MGNVSNYYVNPDFIGTKIFERSANQYGVAQLRPTIPGFFINAKWGEVNSLVEVASWDEFKEKYLEYEDGDKGYEMVYSYFREGGDVCYVSRLCHYTDVSDATTITAKKSWAKLRDIQTTTDMTAATTIAVTPVETDTVLTLASTDAINVGDTIEADDGVTHSFTKTVSAVLNSTQVEISAAIGSTELVPAGTDVDVTYAATVTGDPILQIYGRFPGSPGNELSFSWEESNKIQTTVSVGLSSGVPASSISLKDVTGIRVGEHLQIAYDTSGYLNVKVTEVVGSTVSFEAVTLTDGIAVDNEVVSINYNLKVYRKGEVVTEFYNVSLEPENHYDYIENQVTDTNNWISAEILSTATSTLADRKIDDITSQVLLYGEDSDAITQADVLGDVSTRTGLKALEGWKIPLNIGQVEVVSTTIDEAIIDYCNEKKIHVYVKPIPFGLTKEEVKEHIVDDLGKSSKWYAYFYPNVYIPHPTTGIDILTYNVGVVMGRFSKTDRTTNGGPWKLSAGQTNGLFSGFVRGLEKVDIGGKEVVETDFEDNRTYLHGFRCNDIYHMPGIGYMIYAFYSGDRNPDSKFPQFSHSRTYAMIIGNVDYKYSNFIFEANNGQTRDRIKSAVSKYLESITSKGGLNKDPYPYKVQCDDKNNPREVVKSRTVICQARVNLQDGIERIYWVFGKAS